MHAHTSISSNRTNTHTDAHTDTPTHALTYTNTHSNTHIHTLTHRGDAESLVLGSLREQRHSLVLADLQRIAVHLNRPADIDASDGDAKSLMSQIVMHVSGGDEGLADDLSEALAKPRSRSAAEKLVEDPLFEAAFEEFNNDDKMMFPDVKKALSASKLRRRVNDGKMQRRKRRLTLNQALQEGPRPKKRRSARLGVVRRPRPNRILAVDVEPPAGGPAPPEALPAQPLAPELPAPAPPIAQVVGVVEPVAAPAGPAVPPVAPEHPAPAPPVAQVVGVVEPVAALAVPAVPLPRTARGEPFAGGRFVLAEVFSNGRLSAWTATCKIHDLGERCNQSLTIGDNMSPGDAKRRIMLWCLKGLSIPNTPEARSQHMSGGRHGARRLKPRYYPEASVPSLDDFQNNLPTLIALHEREELS